MIIETILKLFPLEKILLLVMAKLRGITAGQWKRGLEIVKDAAEAFPSSEHQDKPSRDRARRDWAMTQILKSGLLPGQAAHIIENAVPYLKLLESK